MRHLCLILLTGLLAACGSSTSNRSYDFSALDAKLDSYLSANGGPVAGYAFALVDRDGLLHTRAGGDKTLYSTPSLASASKMPAAAAILTLVDQQKLDLDTPVKQYIDTAGDPINWPNDKAAITMRMLLSHTSGLPGLGNDSPQCLDQVLSLTLQQCAQIIANTVLAAQPGSAFIYGGADYQVAGYIATLISGENWQTFFSAAITTPLGLSSFTYGNPDTVTNPRIAGGAVANVRDYAKLLRMVLGGGAVDGRRVLSSGSTQLLTTDLIAGLPVLFRPDGLSSDYPGYGLGMWLSDPSLHPGSNGPEWSDPGLSGATPWVDFDIAYGAVILIDEGTQTGIDMWNDARPLIIAKLK